MKAFTVLDGAMVALFSLSADLPGSTQADLAPARQTELAGRWNVRLAAPTITIDTVLLAEKRADGGIQFTVIGPNPGGLSIAALRPDGGRLRLTGTSVAGPLDIDTALTGGTMTGSFTAGTYRGTFAARHRDDTRRAPVVAMFDQAVGIFERNLFTAAPLDAAWQAKRAELRQTLSAPTATERDLVRSVRQLVNAVRLSHNGYYVPAPADGAGAAAPSGPAVTWRTLDGSIGYIRIAAFVEDPAERDRLDAAFRALRGSRGLIVDVRGNGGGNLGLAMRLGDHLFARPRAAGSFASRKALDAGGVATMDRLPAGAFVPFDGYAVDAFQTRLSDAGAVTLVTGGRSPTYAGPVALLLNRRSGSASEALAAVLKDGGRARLFGSRSAGEMLLSRTIPVADGYVVRVAYADFRTPRGAVAEGVGVRPDQETADTDEAAVAAAATWLREGARRDR